MSVSEPLRRIRCASKKSSPCVAPPSCVKKLGNGFCPQPNTRRTRSCVIKRSARFTIEIRPHPFKLYVFRSFQALSLCSRRRIRQSAARNLCVQVSDGEEQSLMLRPKGDLIAGVGKLTRQKQKSLV